MKYLFLFLFLPTLSFGQYYGEVSYYKKHGIVDLSGDNTYKKTEYSQYRFVFTKTTVTYYAGVEKFVFPIKKITNDRYYVSDEGRISTIKIISYGGAVLWTFRNSDTVFTSVKKNDLISHNIPKIKPVFVTKPKVFTYNLIKIRL